MDIKLIKFEGNPIGNENETLQIQVSSHGKTESLMISFDNYGNGWTVGSKGGLFNSEFGQHFGHKKKVSKIVKI